MGGTASSGAKRAEDSANLHNRFLRGARWETASHRPEDGPPRERERERVPVRVRWPHTSATRNPLVCRGLMRASCASSLASSGVLRFNESVSRSQLS